MDPRRLKWWLDILLTVNHSEAKVMIGNKLILTTRGQSVRSLNTWAKEWGVTKGAIRDFFKLLQSDGMITVESLQFTTRITVCNYEGYQGLIYEKKTGSERAVNGQNTDGVPKQIMNKEELKNIIDYLNLKTGKNFQTSTNKTHSLIQARVKEGYTLENFKTVIDRKAAEWLNTYQDKYLRPETLFGTKFEGYLNERPKSRIQNNQPGYNGKETYRKKPEQIGIE